MTLTRRETDELLKTAFRAGRKDCIKKLAERAHAESKNCMSQTAKRLWLDTADWIERAGKEICDGKER